MPIRALLVDPFTRRIREVMDDFRKLDVLRTYIANGAPVGPDRVYICAGPRLDRDTHTYLDDEGFFRPDQAWFRLRGYPNPLAGYMLVLSSTPEGDERSLSSYFTAELLESVIEWLEPGFAECLVPPAVIQGLDENLRPVGEPTLVPVETGEKRPRDKA